MRSVFLVIFLLACSALQSESCLKIEARCTKSEFDPGGKKDIEFQVENNTARAVAMPEWLYGGSEEDEDSEYFLEIQKKNSNDVYEEAGLNGNDYQYMMSGRKFQVLKPGERIKYSAPMDLLHDLSCKGAYRIKIVVNTQKLIDCGSFVSSTWQDFEIK